MYGAFGVNKDGEVRPVVGKKSTELYRDSLQQFIRKTNDECVSDKSRGVWEDKLENDMRLRLKKETRVKTGVEEGEDTLQINRKKLRQCK